MMQCYFHLFSNSSNWLAAVRIAAIKTTTSIGVLSSPLEVSLSIRASTGSDQGQHAVTQKGNEMKLMPTQDAHNLPGVKTIPDRDAHNAPPGHETPAKPAPAHQDRLSRALRDLDQWRARRGEHGAEWTARRTGKTHRVGDRVSVNGHTGTIVRKHESSGLPVIEYDK